MGEYAFLDSQQPVLLLLHTLDGSHVSLHQILALGLGYIIIGATLREGLA
jgi:hypothetical protein